MIRGALSAVATRCSAFQLAAVVAWILRGFSGWVVALPIGSLVAALGVGTLPAGDRILFEPGGLWLIESLRKLGPSLGASVETEIILLALASVAGVVPHALLFAACGEPARFGGALRRALGCAPRFFLILVLDSGLALLLLAASGLAAALTWEAAPAALTEPGRDLAGLAVFALGLAGIGAAGVLADLLRGASVREPGLPLRAAFRAALSASRAAAGPLASGLLLFSGLGVLLVTLAARSVQWIDVGQPGAGRVVAVFCLHQAALLGLCTLQALWVRRIVTVLDKSPVTPGSAHRAVGGRFERSGAPGDPSPDPGA